MRDRKAPPVLLTFLALAIPAAVLALTLRQGAVGSPARGYMPVAARSAGVPEIGALYTSAHALEHGCTASVVDSLRGNILVTAAHCVKGSGIGMMFAPGQRGRRTPYGRWIVTGAYLEPSWVRNDDADADVAFLTVAPQTIDGVSTEIEQVTGAYSLGSTARRGQRVRVTGYPAGSMDDPITCTTRVYRTETFSSFDCGGFVDGTSGSPLLRVTKGGGQIVGVIGGLHQGGCEDYTSYSSPLRREAYVAYRRAARGTGTGDIAPRLRGDGC